ncbi:hypothetical protein Fmac_006992 [Flemingia macrophylla]|uniref:Pentatricopeptide repeat-containing protein n=1 Tax=Flemingia macrophylla TaxID=520843 RepID=A0ABD1NDD5_9FABA
MKSFNKQEQVLTQYEGETMFLQLTGGQCVKRRGLLCILLRFAERNLFSIPDSEFGDINYADLVFRQIDNPSVYIWNSMIRVLYIADQNCGKCIHSCIVKSGFEADVYTATRLLHMYVSYADMKSGLKMFDTIPKWNIVAWTCLISGYLNNNQPCAALKVFENMCNWGVEPNEITMVNALIACAHSRDIDTGRRVHQHIRKAGYDPFMFTANSNIILATAILEIMINAYNQYGRHREALDLLFYMWSNGFYPDKATFLSFLSVCAQQCALALGQTVHAYAYLLKTGIATDTDLATALLDMYAKTGELGSAKKIFSSLQKKDVVMWTSMINGLAMHGHGNEALSMFQTKQEDSSLTNDRDYGIMPRRDHYGCLVDLLSRAGLFREAERLLETMSVQSNIPIWGAILNGCQIHENLCVANQVKVRLAELEPGQSGVHVLLSNIYAKAGRWEEVNVTRKVMKHRRITKTIGHSSVEMKLLS